MNTNNPFTEVGAIILAVLLVIAGGLLLYTGKVDFTQATVIFGLAAALFGGNLALKAPSATQQTQLSNLQGSLQDLLNLFASHTHPVVPPTPPSTPTQPVQSAQTIVQPSPGPAPVTTQFVPDPSVSMAALNTAQMPVVQKDAQP